MSFHKLDDFIAGIRTHLAGEFQAGFPTLSRIPSTGIIRFLDYFETLPPADTDGLLTTLARLGAMRFFPPSEVLDPIMEIANTDPALLRYRAAMRSPAFTMGLRYEGLRMLKAMLTDPQSMEMMAQERAKLDFTPRDELPALLVPDPDPTRLKPAKAPLLKKLIDKEWKDLLTSGKQKLPGGETGYAGVLNGTSFTVWIDFAAMGLQLRYGVSIPAETKTVLVSRLAYEDLWAVRPGWDYVTEENAEASIRILRELVVQIVRLSGSA